MQRVLVQLGLGRTCVAGMATAAEKYIKHNYWVWVVIGVIVLIVVMALLIGCCVFCLLRRYRHRHSVYYVNLRSNLEDSLRYGSMEMQRSLTNTNPTFANTMPAINSVTTATERTQPEEGVVEAWTNQRKRRESSEREAALLACQFYLRNTDSYSMLNPLPDLGSRVAKYWFMVAPKRPRGQSSGNTSQMILMLAPVAKQCPIALHRENLKTANELLAALKHPYLQSVDHLDYLPQQSSVVIVMTFFPQGSLKDIIYKRQPTYEWSDKYSLRRRGLPPETVALYGRQILEALRVLYRKGFPPLGNLQSGNVFVDRKICRLSGYENTLLGYRSRHYRLVKDHPDAMDTIMFGHLLFEMMCGYELTTLSPSNGDLGNVRSEDQVEVLRYIFSGAESEATNFPNIVDILDLPFFKSVQLLESENCDSSQIQLTSEMKALLRVVRKGRTGSLRDRSSRRKTYSAQENYYPVTQAPPPITRSTSTSTPSQHPKPPPPSSHPPSLPSQTSPPSGGSKGRGELLSDIRRGSHLKTTVTNDKSVPRI